MKNKIKSTIFKAGIWIKEQQGRLTMGGMGSDAGDTIVVPNDLCDKLFDFEDEMIEALYGEDRQVFKPGVVDLSTLMKNIEKQFKKHTLRISFTDTQKLPFYGDYDLIYNFFAALVSQSLSNVEDGGSEIVIYINASVLENHLCVIYRDSLSALDPSMIKEQIRDLKLKLKGEISYKKTSAQKKYYDIMIPSSK